MATTKSIYSTEVARGESLMHSSLINVSSTEDTLLHQLFSFPLLLSKYFGYSDLKFEKENQDK